MEATVEVDHSEEDIYFGKLTLAEIKRHIWLGSNRHTVSDFVSCDDEDSSVAIIETKSEPDIDRENNDWILSPNIRKSDSYTDICDNTVLRKSEQSFLRIEQMVSDLNISSERSNKKLDNTLDIVEYILNNRKEEAGTSNSDNTVNEIDSDTHSKNQLEENGKSSNLTENNITNIINKTPFTTPMKTSSQKNEIFATPLTEIKSTKSCFKTPSATLSHKKSIVKKTPLKSNLYEHITSPIASYIKSTPRAPLVTNVRPKKPLPGLSSIPKPTRPVVVPKPSNKENFNLPQIAYKTAKTIEVTEVREKSKIPYCMSGKKVTSSLPKPFVLKHEHRECNTQKNPIPKQEDCSYANLTLNQAEISYCTQRSAFKNN